MTRCPTCIRREDATHRALGRCPGLPEQAPRPRPAVDQRGYVPPSRSYRVPRDEYLASVCTTAEQKRAKSRETTRRWRERQAS